MTTTQDRYQTILSSWFECLKQWSIGGSLSTTAEHVLDGIGEYAKPQAKLRLLSYFYYSVAGNFEALPEIVLLSAEDSCRRLRLSKVHSVSSHRRMWFALPTATQA